MTDASLCPYRHHNGLLLECFYREVVCKRSFCPYFKTLEQAKASHKRDMQEVGKVLEDKVKEMKRKIKEARKEE